VDRGRVGAFGFGTFDESLYTLVLSRASMPRVSGQTIGAAVGLLAALIIKLQPQIGALDRTGQSALAIMALAVALWISNAIPTGITAVLALGLLIIAGVPSSVALGGFATGAFWILVSVLFFGTAMDKTGLAKRISYRILLIFPPTYPGILAGFMLIGFVLALGIPSMTVRTAIMLPIAFALVQAVNLPLPGRGSALIVIGAFQMAVLPGCAVLTGGLWGPFIAGLFATQKLQLTWLDYAKVMAVPTLIWCVLVIAVDLLIMRPARTAGMSRDVVRSEMQRLGPMRETELLTAAIISIAISAMATQPWHGVPPEAVGMVALAALFVTGVLVPAEIGTGIPWVLAIFVGGMLSLTTVISTYKINIWLGGYIVPAVQPFVAQPLMLVIVMCLAVSALRFIDPVGFIAIAAFFLALSTFMIERGIPPLILIAMIVLPVHIFWFNYQNIWMVMTEGITRKQAYTDADRYKLATAFFGVTIVALWIGVGYWRLIGAL
jgi:solute carrier family 13 (sodium-dependent dicarboxylate transporter), member 2/3/5